MSTFKFIDLFAGIGGLRIPFDELGGKCVFTSEWDKYSQQTYRANFDEMPHGDIRLIEPESIPAHDLIVAGFPCQPFSNAGHRKGLEDARGTLFFNIAKIVEYHRPRVVLLENVRGFKNHDNGKTFAVVKDVLENELGYKLSSKVLNAKDFGVPQSRHRLFMVALRDGSEFKFPEAPAVPTRLGDILEKYTDEKYTISDLLWSSHQRRKRDHLANGNGFGYSLFNDDSVYTRTISARYYKDGSEILIAQKGKNPRKLTPREAARLQGFPDDFKIVVSDTQAYKQFGNAVAVPLIRSIAGNLKEHLCNDGRSLSRSEIGEHVSNKKSWKQKYRAYLPEAA